MRFYLAHQSRQIFEAIAQKKAESALQKKALARQNQTSTRRSRANFGFDLGNQTSTVEAVEAEIQP